MAEIVRKYNYSEKRTLWYLQICNYELVTFSHYGLFDRYIRKQFNYEILEKDCGNNIKYVFYEERDANRALKVFELFYQNAKMSLVHSKPIASEMLDELNEWCYEHFSGRMVNWQYRIV